MKVCIVCKFDCKLQNEFLRVMQTVSFGTLDIDARYMYLIETKKKGKKEKISNV